jgi:thiol-disulfide isomerase/thioredoxin
MMASWTRGGLLVVCLALAGCGGSAARTGDAGTTADGASAALPELRPASVDEILGAVRAPGAEVVVVNVWATWCAPCREEFPDLVRLGRTYRDRGLRLVLVSADFDDQVPAARAFLARHGVDYVSYLKTGDDMAFIDALSPQWTGALPATVVYDGRGNRTWFHEGKTDYATLERQVLEVIDTTPKEESPS